MRRLITRAIVTAAILTVCGVSATAQRASVSDFRQQLSRLYSAINRGDSGAVRALVADNLVWIVGASGAPISKAQLVAAAGAANSTQFQLDSLRVHASDAAAVVEYIRTDRRPLGRDSFTTHWRRLQV